jgi:hypothetical protein
VLPARRETTREGSTGDCSRSAGRRASRSWSQFPEILFKTRLRRCACSSVTSRKMTGTVFQPRRRAATRRWWPPITILSSCRASTSCTNPNSRSERVSASRSWSLILRGLDGSGRSSAMGIWTICRSVGDGLPLALRGGGQQKRRHPPWGGALIRVAVLCSLYRAPGGYPLASGPAVRALRGARRGLCPACAACGRR